MTSLQIRTKVGNFTVSTVSDGLLFSTVRFDDRLEFDQGTHAVKSGSLASAVEAHETACLVAAHVVESDKRDRAPLADYPRGKAVLFKS